MTHFTQLGRAAMALSFVLAGVGCGDGGEAPTDGGSADAMSSDATTDDQAAPDDAEVADAEVDGDVESDMGGGTDMGGGADMGGGTDMGGGADMGACTGADADGDGVPNVCDRCALGADQLDADLDTVPDACDRCVGFSDVVDTDGDTVPDGCDICAGGSDSADGDGDGVPNACDICPAGHNGQDSDSDGTPNACDVCAGHSDAMDADNDGVPNGCDICAGHSDVVDTDLDGVPNGCDECAGHDDGVDTDMDGFADGCDCEPDFPEGHPGLTEVCDGLDNDCSGGVDNGLVGCSVLCRPREVDWDLDGEECEAMGRVIYVDAGATGDADGTSWADAYLTIEAAILDAEAAPAGSKQIWVAAGTYSPSRVVGYRLVTLPIRGFVMPARTALLGGFAGTESAAVDADPATHVTVLGPGALTRMFVVAQPAVRVDGFDVLSGGELAVVTAGALHASRIDAQGVYSSGVGYPVVQVVAGDVTFEDVALHDGSIGIEAIGGTVLCERCVITRNGLGASFGAASPSGGVSIVAGFVTLRNSAVINNGAAGNIQPSETGPAAGVVISGAAGRLRAENSTIAGNNGSRYITITTRAPAGLDVQRGTATIVNSIVQNNDGGNSITATVVSSSVEGRAGACAPLFSDPTTLAGIQLGAASTCINAGDTSMSQGVVDLVGAPRVRGAAVDLGALESQP